MKKRKETGTQPKVQEFLREAEKEIEASTEDVKIEIPSQPEFFKTPVRFGNIPVDKLPTGCDEKEQYRKIYPKIQLPFQVVERVSFGHKEIEPNQLIFGDNLHIMRSLPSNSIDLIYIDPPFFSGRNYNVVFGDQNEVRSFTDIWEGGMPGYLTWLNARLLEMKRLLKPIGTIFVHCDRHASHYIKIEMDKIFGYENFRNEIIWCYTGPSRVKDNFPNKHDVIFRYTKSKEWIFNAEAIKIPYSESFLNRRKHKEGSGGIMGNRGYDEIKDIGEYNNGKLPEDFWTDIPSGGQISRNELIGYPTQKPEKLLTRIIDVASRPNDVVADFFCGGGTTPVVAQRLGRRWIASDISKVALSVTRDRLIRDALKEINKELMENQEHSLPKVPDMQIEHWGIYEIPQLVRMNDETFKHFIIAAYNARGASSGGLIHGYKNQVPLFIGSASQDKPITETEVITFAKDIVKKKGHHQGTMIAWGFTPGAQSAAQQLASQHALAIDFVKIQLIPLESESFREHITSKHPEYRGLLKFILPPEVRCNYRMIDSHEYEFDVSESVSLNPSGKIINVQWDFSYNGERFVSTPGYAFLGMKNNRPILKISYMFTETGKTKVACKVQDDEGGEKLEAFEVDVK